MAENENLAVREPGTGSEAIVEPRTTDAGDENGDTVTSYPETPAIAAAVQDQTTETLDAHRMPIFNRRGHPAFTPEARHEQRVASSQLPGVGWGSRGDLGKAEKTAKINQ